MANKKTLSQSDLNSKFIDSLLKYSTDIIYVGVVPNDRDTGGRETKVVGRDPDKIKAFIEKHDRPENKVGIFYCVGQLKQARRIKDNWSGAPIHFLDIDLKDVDLTQAQVVQRLENLPIPPTRVIASGNGLHVHWQLKEVQTDLHAFESTQKDLVKILAGDRLAAHAVTLLRMPGSHNSKRGEWKSVDVLYDTGKLVDTEALTQWATTAIPVILTAAKEKLNNFQRVGEEQGHKAPIDWEDELKLMTYHDEEHGVHGTQIRCTASMLNSGMELEEVVELVYKATEDCIARADMKGEAPFNWAREKQIIRNMCNGFVRKVAREDAQKFQKVKPRLAVMNDKSGAGDDKVVSLDQRRRESRQADEESDDDDEKPRGGKKGAKGKGDKTHIILAMGVLANLDDADEMIRFVDGQMWHYRDGLWSVYPTDKDATTFLNTQIEQGFAPLKVVSTTKYVNEAREYIKRQPDLHVTGIKWDNQPGVHTRSGVVDPFTGDVRRALPEDYWTSRIDCDFTPDADCPVWKQMLHDTFGQDEIVDMVQEVLGAALLKRKPKQLTKALVLIGGSNSGKSTILNVLAGLFGQSANSTTFRMIEQNAHGLVSFLKPVPWVLHEAFEQGIWQESSAVKALLSGDPVEINIKGGAILSHSFKSPVFWGSNAPPQFKESSRAMENRLLPIRCARIFTEESPVGVAVEARERGYPSPADMVLAEEKSGVLNWAMKGVQRLFEAGHFSVASNTQTALSEMRREGNRATGFISDCCDYDPTSMVMVKHMSAAFFGYLREEEGALKDRGAQFLGRQFKALADARIGMGDHFKFNNIRYIVGLRLNANGLDHYLGGSEHNQGGNNAAPHEVNEDVPDSVGGKPEYMTILSAYPDGLPARPGAEEPVADAAPSAKPKRTPRPPKTDPAKVQKKADGKQPKKALRPLSGKAK